MPKIRLSALATDIKGKAGGSVFARNSGGVYFRNNPSGTGSKKEIAQTQKQKFGILSTQWKNLTTEQKDAWKSAVADYPTKNAFGEPRLPSGYELFMRVNGVLVGTNLPLILVPGVKRSAPESFEWYYETPENFCFTPQYVSAFPAFVNPYSLPNACSSASDCPEGSVCFNGLCFGEIVNPPLGEPECSTNEDCGALGLGTGNDVECQGGECVYVGDGIPNVNGNAYGFAAGTAVQYGGDWAFDDENNGSHQLTFSMRVIPDASWKSKLTNRNGLVQLLGNATRIGSGLNLYIVGGEDNTAMFVMTWGVNSADVAAPKQTTLFSFPIALSELSDSFHVSCYLDTRVLSNSTMYFNGVELEKNIPACYKSHDLEWFYKYGVVEPEEGVCSTDWSTTDKFFNFIIGQGYLPDSLPFAFNDVRFYDGDLTAREHVLISRGYVLNSEIIAIPFNNEKDKFVNVAGLTAFQIRAVYMQAVIIPNDFDDNTIPSIMSIDWITVKNSPFSPNPTVFCPFVEVYTPDEGLIDWTFNVKTTGPFNDSRSVDHQPTRSILAMETVAANYAEIGGLMGISFGNFPNNSAFSVQGVLIDNGSGDMIEPAPKRPPYSRVVRFKAGAELSGKVN
jgi:hypothetical protein